MSLSKRKMTERYYACYKEIIEASDVDQVLAKAGSGELDIFDVMSTPKNPEEAAAASIIQNMFDDVSAEQDIDPDDGFDQILSIVKDQLADTYNDSTLEAVNP
jgi:hypothetical protein